MTLKINATLSGRNKFCGPAVVAGVLACSTDEAAKLIRRESGQRAVKGAYTPHVLAALRRAGGQCRTYIGIGMQRQRVWQIAPKRPLSVAVIRMPSGGGHFVLIRRGKVLDSFSRCWKPVAEHVHRNCIVTELYRVDGKPKLPKPPKPRKRKRRKANPEHKAMLAKAIHHMPIGNRLADEFFMSEEGRWEDDGKPDTGHVCATLDRVPGKMVFFDKVEIADAVWAVNSGTLQIHMPMHFERFMYRLFAVARQFDLDPHKCGPHRDS